MMAVEPNPEKRTRQTGQHDRKAKQKRERQGLVVAHVQVGQVKNHEPLAQPPTRKRNR